MCVKGSDVEWETLEFDQVVSGVYGDYSIEISGREQPQTVDYKVSMPNLRTWLVEFDCETIGHGEADGLRASKKEALAVLNAHRNS